LQRARYREAIAELQQALALSRRGVMELMYLGHAYAVAGQRQEAEKVLNELKALSRQRFVPPEYLGVIYAGFPDKDRAFEWFEKAYQERSMHAWLLPDPRLDSLRSDPRFANLLHRMNLAP
jgi:tetratricopeptide (TPR) repeat protein